jgi:hypothetical protein
MKSTYLDGKYDIRYDFNHDRKVDEKDVELLTKIYFGFRATFYEETRIWQFGK